MPPATRCSTLPHVDGPFAVWPFAHGVPEPRRHHRERARRDAVRAPAGIATGRRRAGRAPGLHACPPATVLAFDFNRELHFIRNLPERIQPRAALRAQGPLRGLSRRGLAAYGRLLGRLTGIYDHVGAQPVLELRSPPRRPGRSSRPTSWSSTPPTWGSMLVTRYVGWGNVAVRGGCWPLASVFDGFDGFRCSSGASFVHYLLYLGGVSSTAIEISVRQVQARCHVLYKGVAYAHAHRAVPLDTFSFEPALPRA